MALLQIVYICMTAISPNRVHERPLSQPGSCVVVCLAEQVHTYMFIYTQNARAYKSAPKLPSKGSLAR